jgi:hypothetical protein
MLPPEVILDRWVKSQAFKPEFSGYLGKLDIEKVELGRCCYDNRTLLAVSAIYSYK